MIKNTSFAQRRLLSKIALLSASSLVLLAAAAHGQTINTAGTYNYSGNASVTINATSTITNVVTIAHAGAGALTLTDVSNPGIINIGTIGTAFFVDSNANSEVVADFQNLKITGDGGIDFRSGMAKSIAITFGQNSSVDFGYIGSNGIIIRNTNSAANNTITVNGTITSHALESAISATGVEFAVTGGTNRAVIGQTGAVTTTGSGSSHAVQISDTGSGINIVKNHGTLLSTGTAHTVSVTTSGGSIDITNTGTIEARSAAGAHAIYASSTGTGTINITASSGAIKTANGSGIYALNNNAGAGNITINTTGAVLDITSGGSYHGIHARLSHPAATAGISVITGTGTIDTAGHGIYAANQGSGDTFISATNGLSITTTGVSAHGIYATGIGNIFVASQATISATGTASSGIYAQSSTGNVAIGYNGDGSENPITGNITSGSATDVSQAIYAVQTGAAPTGTSARILYDDASGIIKNTSVDAGGGLSYRPAIFANTNVAGNSADAIVTVRNVNLIETDGYNAIGIAAFSQNGNAIVNFESGKIRTIGRDGDGIYAAVNGTTGNGNVIINAGGEIETATTVATSTDPQGIIASNAGLGNIGITFSGSSIKTSSQAGVTIANAISAAHAGTGTGSITIDVTNTDGLLQTFGGTSHGITASITSAPSAGNITIGSANTAISGTISTIGISSHGISANTAGIGNITINNAATITTGAEGDTTKGASAKGIYAATRSGSITVTNSGDITTWNNANTGWTAATGIYANATEGGNIDITSSGNITSGTTAIYAHGLVVNSATDQAGRVTVNASGEIHVTSASASHAIIVQAKGVNGVTDTTFDNGIITGPASGIIAGSDVLTSHASNTLNIGSNAVINTQGTIVELFINSGTSQAVIAQGARLEGDRGFCADIITDNGIGHTGQGTLSINNAGSIMARRANETTSALAVERNWLNNNLAIDTILASVEVVNSGTIEGPRGIVSGHASSTILAAASITNTGTITARNTLGEAILLLDGNQNVTLGTGSVINGHIYSAEVGNTVTLIGTATEDANFIGAAYNTSATYTGLSTTNNFASLTVKTDDLVDTNWTLNGSAGQLDGVDVVVINNGANNTVSTLTLAPSTAGDYTFDHALSGDGTLKITLQDANDAIVLGNNVGTVFQGTLAAGTGSYALTAGTDNETSLTSANLRFDKGSTTTVTGNNTTGGVEFNGGDIKFLATIPGSLISPDTIAVDQLTINNTISRSTVQADMGWMAGVVHDPSDLSSRNLLDQDNEINLVTLISSANPVIGSSSALELVDLGGINWTRVESDGIILKDAGGTAIGNAYYGYGLTTGQSNDGLYLGYLLKRVVIEADKTLHLNNTSAALMPNDFTAQIDAASATVVVSDTTGNGITINNTENTIETLVVRQGTLQSGGDEGFGKVHTLVVENGALATVNGHCQVIDNINVADGGSIDLTTANCEFTSMATAVLNGYVRIGDTSILSLKGTSVINDRINNTGTLDNQGQMLFSRTASLSGTSSSTLQNRGVLIAETGAQGGSLLNNTGLLLIAESPSGNALSWNDSVNNFGVIRFAPENIGYNRFNIGNRYSGNGDLYLNAYLDTPANSQIDQVKIYGHASGVTKVYINNRGGKGGETEGEGLLTISTFSSDAGAFILGKPVLTGLTYYDLVLGSNGYEWYLQSNGNLTGGGSAILTGAAGNAVSWFAQNDSLLKRMGDIRLSDGTAANGTFWMRAYGQQNNLDLKISGAQNSRLYTYGGDVGSDILLDAGDGMLATGAFVGYAGNRNNVRNADGSHGSMDSIYFGLYATYMHDSGFYADFIAKGQTFTTDFDSYGTGGADSGSYDGWGAGTSLELGWQFESPKGWFVEPSVQAAYMHAFNDTYTTQQSLRVQMQDADILQFSGMIRFGKTLNVGEYLLQPYGKFGVMEQVTDGGHVRVEQGRWKPTVDGTSAVFGAGLNFQVSMDTQIHLDYEASFSEKNDKPWGINLGVTTRF
ncbi:MAG: autotransporter outer membrane beta-barrel domain-containing protein [Puniceicoccales bacterium]|jgi:autotransporter family porin|nr:autotransporter outer membrane beta-barrel domain-containing protein [Puniceicoccales bacterium]